MSSASASASTPLIMVSHEIPTAEEFDTEIEPENVPAVFKGCIKDWKAFADWNPSNGGLDYLQGKVGLSLVEAMLSEQAPVFYGDIRSHEKVSVPFSTFIEYCKSPLQNRCDDDDVILDSRKHMPAGTHDQSDFYGQIYLAQVPILNDDCTEKVQLKCLKDDIETPSFLATKTLESVNLWMNSSQSRSSTHYDPHNNLLCIVSGSKKVVLWPPSACPFLYPQPIYAEDSNHSAIILENPNFCAYPRAKLSAEYCQKVVLHAGDALFIPEGWYHQVDSENLTIAVNFWWRSDMMTGLLEHMDSYYLRRILKRLIDKEMNDMLHLTSVANDEMQGNTNDQSNYWNAGEKLNQTTALHELDSVSLSALHELVSLVHDRVKPSQSVDSTIGDTLVVREKDEPSKITKVDLYKLKDDLIAKVLWTLKPLCLQRVFVTMAHNFPRTLEALILHVLSPVGAEVLTRKFEEMNQLISVEERNQFYEIFYGVFENRFEVMDALLNAKESFSRQAFKNVLDQYLRIHLDGSNPSVEGGMDGYRPF